MDEVKSKSQIIQQRVASKTANFFAGIDHVFRRVDQRAIVGVIFVMLALVMVGRPDTGTIAWLDTHGISPRGYGYVMAVVGAVILRWPRLRAYGLLTLVFIPYLCATFGYTLEGNINPAPDILYIGLFYFMLRAE